MERGTGNETEVGRVGEAKGDSGIAKAEIHGTMLAGSMPSTASRRVIRPNCSLLRAAAETLPEQWQRSSQMSCRPLNARARMHATHFLVLELCCCCGS